MFKTPTLRNTAMRRVFFHNGVFHALQEVHDFYNFRDTKSIRVRPTGRCRNTTEIRVSIRLVSMQAIRRSTGISAKRRQ